MADLDDVAEHVLKQRYLRKDGRGEVVETPPEMFDRVAGNLARAEGRYGGETAEWTGSFREAMSSLAYLPNSPTLMNAGTSLKQLAACFVLPVADSLTSIFDAVKQAALIHQSGGGTGFSFSDLRPAGDVVGSTGGVASGPVSFMKVFDAATEQIKQGGRRRGANMGVLDATHPDVDAFVDAKRDEGVLRNFNISVATDETFWDAVTAGGTYPLVHPGTGEEVDERDADGMLNRIAETAWATGDPGLLFLDRIAEDNPTPDLGTIEATNPCGEVPLLPYEACVLGSINLGEMTTDGPIGDRELDEAELEETVRVAVRMLDDAIEMSEFPLPEIDEMMGANRKIGLGVMGFHDMLVDLDVPYDSDEAVDVAGDVMEQIAAVAHDASCKLAETRGAFPNWEVSTVDEERRNATLTSIAPTGTISMIAGCSAGIEPLYNVAYTKQVMGGLDMVDDRFVEVAEERGFHSEELMDDVHGRTSLADVDAIPEDVRELFKTAHDVPADRHLEMQAAFQDHVDNAVSKTVNLAPEAEPAAVRRIYAKARVLDVKGITVFRAGSRDEQVLGDQPPMEECAAECDYVRPETGPAGER